MKPLEWAPGRSDRYPYREKKCGLAKELWGVHRSKTTWVHNEKMAICKPRRENAEETTPLALWSWTSGLQNCEKINFCCFSHPICRTSSWQPEQTKTRVHCFLSILPFLIPSPPSHTAVSNRGRLTLPASVLNVWLGPRLQLSLNPMTLCFLLPLSLRLVRAFCFPEFSVPRSPMFVSLEQPIPPEMNSGPCQDSTKRVRGI